MTQEFVTLPREVVEQVLKAAEAFLSHYKRNIFSGCVPSEELYFSAARASLRAALEQPQVEQEPVGYEYVEHRPYGAPGEIRRGTILLEHYRNNADGKIAGDWEWLVQQFKTSKNTISMRPLYTQPQPKREPLTPLTDEQLKAIINKIDRDEQYIQPALRQLARDIEAAHNIK